ncbi:MAG: hypothetical protein ACREBU_01855 [Nitrososphaera sp.]
MNIAGILNAGQFGIPIYARMVELAYLVLSVLSPLKNIAACRMVDNDHVFWVERKHFMVVVVGGHVADVDSLPGEELFDPAPKMEGATARATDVAPVTTYIPKPRALSA